MPWIQHLDGNLSASYWLDEQLKRHRSGFEGDITSSSRTLCACVRVCVRAFGELAATLSTRDEVAGDGDDVTRSEGLGNRAPQELVGPGPPDISAETCFATC